MSYRVIPEAPCAAHVRRPEFTIIAGLRIGERLDPMHDERKTGAVPLHPPAPSRRRAANGTQSRLRTAGRIGGWGLVVAVALYYVSEFAVEYFVFDAEIYGSHWGHAGWLLLHIAGGVVALLVGPFQLWAGLRRRYMRVHRWSGRIYLTSVGVSAVAAAYILMLPENSFGFRIGIAGLAIAWVTTTGLAYVAVRRRHFQQHKEWMVRSYVVTFGFVFYRIMYQFFMPLELASRDEMVSATSWMCWAVPLFVTEVVLQGRKIFKGDMPYNSKLSRRQV